MRVVETGSVRWSGPWTRPAVILSVGLMLLLAQPGQAQWGSLNYYKSHFVTGDYVVGGVGLRGKGILDTTTQNKLGSAWQHYAGATIMISAAFGHAGRDGNGAAAAVAGTR